MNEEVGVIESHVVRRGLPVGQARDAAWELLCNVLGRTSGLRLIGSIGCFMIILVIAYLLGLIFLDEIGDEKSLLFVS